MAFKYDIIWVDDICHQKHGESYIKLFETVGLRVHSYETRQQGMDALLSGIKCDAIVLDGKCADDSEDQVMTEAGLVGMIYHIRNHYKIPYFIYTGQSDLVDSSVFCKQYDYRVYQKGKLSEKPEPSGIKSQMQLLKDIISEIEASPRNRIKNLYSHAFAPIEKGYISSIAETPLLDILEALHSEEAFKDFNSVNYYNSMRQMVEYIFRGANRYGILPDAYVVDGKVNLRLSSMYLAGKEDKINNLRYGEEYDRVFPPYIENIIRSILDLCNLHSHTIDLSKDDEIKIEQFFLSSQSKYLVFSFALQMCEVLAWFHQYVINHLDIEQNRKTCRRIVPSSKNSNSMLNPADYEGKEYLPIEDEKGNYHCGPCLINPQYWRGGIVRLKNITPNTRKDTQTKYPFYAKIERI